MKHIKVIIGKNFGDEGKGLLTAYFVKQAVMTGPCIVVKHNGGAQAGHTVEWDGKRFVFHQLGSGTVYGARTMWDEHFMPDLYKLSEETEAFLKVAKWENLPKIYALEQTGVTLYFDVILNQLSESLRDSAKHGSCGMGIWEAYLRMKNPEYIISLKDVKELSHSDLVRKMVNIRNRYVKQRLVTLQELFPVQLSSEQREMVYLLFDDNVVTNTAVAMKENLDRWVELIADDSDSVIGFLQGFDTVVFESGQGLMLDFDNEEFMPNLTPSKTGSTNVWKFLKKYEISVGTECEKNVRKCTVDCELCYVTRSYVTRHGAGYLPLECGKDEITRLLVDKTNVFNTWQGELRYAKHGCYEDFLHYISEDLKKAPAGVMKSLAVTHLNETENQILSEDGFVPLCEYTALSKFERVYGSASQNPEKIDIIM